jgi:hypothetical protein
VQVRFDFLALSPAEEQTEVQGSQFKVQSPEPELEINIPRDVPSYVSDSESDSGPDSALRVPRSALRRASAFIPLSYISEARQRIEIYRKLAQATDKSSLDRLKTEMRDRFGPVPPAIELLLLVAEIKILASEKGISIIEVKEDKLMLTRNQDYIMLSGKFPRLTKEEPVARLKEIKKMLLAL